MSVLSPNVWNVGDTAHTHVYDPPTRQWIQGAVVVTGFPKDMVRCYDMRTRETMLRRHGALRRG